VRHARALTALWPVSLALALAALWPLSAYAVHPLGLPAAFATAFVIAVSLQRPDFGVAVALALAPFLTLSVGNPGGGSSQPFQYVLPLMALALAAYGALQQRPAVNSASARWVIAALVVYLLVAVASAVQAIAPEDSVNKLILLFTTAALFMAVLETCKGERELLTVCGGAVAGLLLTALFAIAQHLLGFEQEHTFTADGNTIARATGASEHPAGLGYYIGVVGPLAVALAIRGTPAWLRQLSIAAAVVAPIALIFSYSRTAIIAAVVGPVLWTCLARPRAAIAALGLAGILALVVLTGAPGNLKSRFDPQQTSEDAELREDAWGAGFEISAQHPLLGAGINNFSNAYATLPTTARNTFRTAFPAQGSRVTPSNAHDGYLNTLAEQGVVGLGALLFLLGTSAVVLLRASREGSQVARRACFGIGAGASAWAFANLVDTSMITSTTLVGLALIAVVCRFHSLARQERAGIEAPS
jgi:O-antigen ligase